MVRYQNSRSLLGCRDLAVVRQHRGDHNRLGFAVRFWYPRYPGRVLADACSILRLMIPGSELFHQASEVSPGLGSTLLDSRFYFRRELAGIKRLIRADADFGEALHQLHLGRIGRAVAQHEVQDVEELQRGPLGFFSERLDEINGRGRRGAGVPRKAESGCTLKPAWIFFTLSRSTGSKSCTR